MRTRLRIQGGDGKPSWRDWIRAVPQGSTYLGLTLIVVMWATVIQTIHSDKDQALRTAARNTATLARAFEEYTQRTIKEVDKTLLLLRSAYDKAPASFDLPSYTSSAYFLSDVTLQVAQIGPDGMLLSTNLGPQTAPTDLSDREHFRVQRDAISDGLFISKPVLGRTSGRWSVQLTRRLTTESGHFGGVLVASIDPDYFARFFASMEEPLGPHGAVTILGEDGVVRARGSRASKSAIGVSLTGTPFMAELLRGPEGSFLGLSPIDGRRRLTSFRKIAGFPLYVIVSEDEADLVSPEELHHSELGLVALLLSAMVVMAMSASIGHAVRLERTRRDLSASEARASEKSGELKVALENMSQGIMMIDADRRVAVINQRAVTLLGLPDDVLTRRPAFAEILEFQWRSGEFGAQGSALDPEVRAFIESGGIADEVTVYERRRPNGTVLEVRSLPLPGGGTVRTYTDVTERTKTAEVLAEARDRAESASRARTAFLAMMSHEIRTPLNGVIGMASLLAGTSLDEEQRRYTGTLRDSAEHLLQIIDDVLDFSKLEADRGTFEEVAFDLEQTLESVLSMVAPRAREKGLFIGGRLHPAIPDMVVGDAGALRQVLLNLTGNGVKFTAEGSVTVEAVPVADLLEGDGQVVRFSVRDTGIGIDAAAIPLLFQEFSQLDGSIARRFGGTGLGLAISKHLVERLGGRIEVESMPGKGSTFSFTMPFCRAEGASRGVPARPLAGQTWVLLGASDDVRDFDARLLADLGAENLRAEGTEEALGLACASASVTGIIVDGSAGPIDLARSAGELAAGLAASGRPLLAIAPLGTPGPHAAAMAGALVLHAPLSRRILADAALGWMEAPIPAPPTAAASTLPQAPLVLVAEDNRTNRLVAEALLTRMGYRVATVVNGEDALERQKRDPADIILMDLMMPGMDGFAAARAIRDLEGPAGQVPIIALTANALTTGIDSAREAGMDDFATKPITRERLDAVIGSALARRRAGRPGLPVTPAAPAEEPEIPVLDAGAWDAIRSALDAEMVAIIVTAFVEDTAERLAALESPGVTPAFAAQETHALKSAAGTFGLARLQALAARIEAEAGTLPGPELAALLRALRPAFEEGRAALALPVPADPALPTAPEALVA